MGDRCLCFRIATCTLQLALCFGALLFKHFSERITGIADVFAKQVAGRNNVALAAQIEYLVMLFVCPFYAMSIGATPSSTIDRTWSGWRRR